MSPIRLWINADFATFAPAAPRASALGRDFRRMTVDMTVLDGAVVFDRHGQFIGSNRQIKGDSPT